MPLLLTRNAELWAYLISTSSCLAPECTQALRMGLAIECRLRYLDPVAALLWMAPRLGLHELDIESDGNLVSNQNAAGLEGGVPGQAEVFSVDLCTRRDCDPCVAPGILGRWCRTLYREADLASDAVDSEVAFD
jgi:hypothetical protein